MLYEKIRLDENDENAYLEVYVADKVGDFVRSAILVIPGGGYSTVCSEREGEPIAMAFMPHGFNAFVLHYSVCKKPFPIQLIQASLAIKHIRDNSEKYNIDPDKVFTVGFSAGGHLVASLGTMWDYADIYDEIKMPYGYNKPTGMMLIYPVISQKYHCLSIKNLLMKKEPTVEEMEFLSLENHVSEKTCPAFIMHTSNDQVVDVKNSLLFAEKMSNLGLKFEMHIYPDAPHGAALGNEITECGVEKWRNSAIEKWISQAVEWAQNINNA